MVIIKRDGTKQDFDKKKIEAAVLKAFFAVDGKIDDYAIDKAKNIASFIESVCETEDEELEVEAIQDLVERGLCATKRKDVAKEYILYRHERSVIRTRNSKLRQRVMEKLMATNVQNQNANVDEYSFGGRNGEAASEQNRDIALNDIISPKSRDNHLNNRIYIHDLDSYAIGMHNCLTIPFDKLLANGFNTRQTDIRPANSIGTAFQLLAVIFQCQSLCQFGGVSASHLDWTMVPYVRKSFYKHFKDGLEWVENDTYTEVKYEDLIPQNHIKNVEEDYWTHSSKKLTTSEGDCYYDNLPINIYEDYHEKAYKYAMDMTKRELKQAVEGMFHNLNSLQSRSGNQLPFTSINFGTCTLIEGRMVIEALLRGSLNGVGALHRTSIFPCSIFQVGEGINKRPGDPNYDLFKLALQSTAKRLYPNYANIDWSGNAGYDKNDPRTYFATMGCRTANGWDINGFGQLKDGRGNICPVTIILPTLAMEAVKRYEHGIPCGDLEQDTIDLFMQILTDAIEDAKDTLIERFDYICSQNAASARFMYENGLMEGYVPEEGIKSALKHGTLAVGMLGLAEALQLLVGCDHTEEKGMKIAKQICQLYKDKCAKYKEEYKLNFGVYYSPAENLCYTAMKKFKKKYGEIPNVSDKDFFTNSIHVPVWKKITAAEKINIESQLTGYSSAGCITYIELEGRATNNIDAIEKIVIYAMDKDIPYFAINVPNDTCMNCGFTDEINNTCPKCGGTDIQRLRRVTGYLTGNYTTSFNLGKQQEVTLRSKHEV